MEIEKTLILYLQALEEGSYEDIIELFTDDAVINSPLYGNIKALTFYKELFKDTTKSTITVLNLFTSKENKNAGAAHFRYEWILKDGTPTSFECVDTFQFSDDNKIKHLTIIYDTYRIRQHFEKIKR
ncbi:MAG: nuclear transport factor 2 family protein [Methanomicrobia archaeon]|nr:nuclear transport factor 2 family protein [Methanomicrobia archaeon]